MATFFCFEIFAKPLKAVLPEGEDPGNRGMHMMR